MGDGDEPRVTDSGVRFVRTPERRFEGLADFPYEPRYVAIDGLRMAWVETGPSDGPVVLLLHGEPTWSYLYRRMIEPLTSAGYRVVAPDLIGFGRSDKPVDRSVYTYAAHVDWMRRFVEHLDLRGVTAFVQDWGGLIGLRLAAENAERFDRLVIANTVLPVGDPMSDGFMFWRELSQTMDPFDAGALVQQATQARELTEAEMDAYRAPFPDERHMAGAREFPVLVPISPEDPAVPANRAAWDVLESWTKPTLTLWGIDDAVLGGYQSQFVDRIPGAAGQPHQTFTPAGHFIQDDRGEELAAAFVAWMRDV